MKFIYSDDNKRYHTFNYYLKHHFKSKVFKVSLNASFTCPNRDGKVGVNGCTFCSSLGSGDFAGDAQDDLLIQFDTIKTKMHLKWPTAKYIAYFQAYTNTYASLDTLKRTYQPFINKKDVVALSIATRPDCLEDDVITYLDSLTKDQEIWVELGLQTTNDQVAQAFNRGYDYDVFLKTIERLKATNLKICVHMINGLPNESKEMMIDNIKKISCLPIHGIKIHMLHLVDNTKMADDYINDPWPLLTLDEYVEITCEQLRYLDKEIIVQRLSGDANKDDLVAPTWTLNKMNVLNSIDKHMASHDYVQGELLP